MQDLLREYENYNNKLASGETLTIAEQQAFNTLKENITDAYEALKDINPETEGYTQTITDFLGEAEKLIPSFDEMTMKAYGFSDANQEVEVNLGRVASGLAINTEEANKLKQTYPELNEYLNEQNGLWTLNTDLIFDSAAAGEEWAQKMASSFIKATEEAIEFNKALARLYLSEAREARLKYGAGSVEDTAAWNEYAAILKEIDQMTEDLRLRKAQQFAFPEPVKISGLDETEDGVKATSEAVKTLIDLLKEELELLDHQAFLAEKNGKDQMELVRIYEEAQKRIHAVAEEYRKQGYDDTSAEIRELQKLWWDYADEIADVNQSIKDAQEKAAEEAKQAWEEAQQELIDELNDKKSAYETAFNYIADQIQKEIDALQEQRNAEEEYWDAKINALEDQNDEIERQIELEQLQEQLARARQGKVLVYKDGRFQYVQDVEAISEAEKNLEEYEREEALRQETENLEQLRDQALAAIDDQIEGWEKYKEEWSSVVSDYQEEQDKLLAEQVLGIELEGENWQLRLDNLSEYVEQYKSLMQELVDAQNATYEGLENNKFGNQESVPGGGGSLPDGFFIEENPSTAWVPGVGNVRVEIEDGKTITEGLPVGTIVSPSGTNQKYEITGVNPDGSYQSRPVGSGGSGSSSSSGGGSSSRPSGGSSSHGSGTASGSGNASIGSIIGSVVGGPVGGIIGGLIGSLTKHADGTTSAPGGVSLVGEKGPELRLLNSGDGIVPANLTKNLMDIGRFSAKDLIGQKQNITYNTFDKLVLPNVTDAQSFIQELKRFKQYAFQQ